MDSEPRVISEPDLPHVIDLDQEIAKAEGAHVVEHFHGYSLPSEVMHALFCNNRLFPGCSGHYPRTCKDCRKTTGSGKS